MHAQPSATLPTIARICGAAGGGLSLIARFMPNWGFEDGETFTYWELFSRWDVAMALALLALIAVSALALVRGGRLWDTLIVALGGFAGTGLLYVVEVSDTAEAGSYM